MEYWSICHWWVEFLTNWICFDNRKKVHIMYTMLIISCNDFWSSNHMAVSWINLQSPNWAVSLNRHSLFHLHSFQVVTWKSQTWQNVEVNLSRLFQYLDVIFHDLNTSLILPTEMISGWRLPGTPCQKWNGIPYTNKGNVQSKKASSS